MAAIPPPAAATEHDPRTRRIGRYVVESQLGHGTMGVVYRARDVECGELVALKMAARDHEQNLAALRREVHALRSLHHPGVVAIRDEGVHAGLPWFAMELLEGRTFRDWLEETWPARGTRRVAGGRLDELLALMSAICEPLARVHEQGIVHRDVKPENVHLRPDGPPVLVDFGLFARAGGVGGREILDIPPGLAGTDFYMAPEQIRGEFVDARADLYALGCMLYEAIAGEPPFTGATTGEILHRHLEDTPVPLSARLDGVPPWLDELVLRLLSKSRRERLGYADVLAAQLARGRVTTAATAGERRGPLYLYRAEFIGRTEALTALEADVAAAAAGRGAVRFVGGESGIGKTRLAMEAAKLAASRGMAVVLGPCTVVGDAGGARVAAGPLHPFRRLLALIADRCRTLGRAETDRILGARGPILAPYDPSLAELPGQDAYPPPAAVSPEAAHERLQRAVVETVAAHVRAAGPLFFVLDDLQWADELSLRVVAALMGPTVRALPILLVGTYRSEELEEEHRRLVAAEGARPIELERLAPDGVRRMVGDMLALTHAPDGLVTRLFGDTEGNPFLVSEYLLVAVDEGVLDCDEAGRWQLHAGGAGAALSIPRSLQGLVGRRLERLSAPARRVAEIASVLGQSFDTDLLMHATVLGEAATLDAVHELVRRRMLERDDGDVLAFTHGKIREVTYEGIAPERRAAYHEHAARSIESFCRDPEVLQRQASALAHHWRQAALAAPGDVELAQKAIEWLERAGEQAARSYASHDTVRLFEDALRLYARERRHLGERTGVGLERWERRLGEAYFRLGRMPEARDHLEQALAHLGEPARPGRRRLLVGLAAQVGRHLLHRILPARVAGRADPAERPRALEAAAIYEQLGLILFINLETRRASYTNLRALTLAESYGPSSALAGASALTGLSVGLLFGSRAADRYFDQATRTAHAVGDRYGYGRVLYTRSLVLAGLGRWQEGRQAVDDARATFVEIGDTRWRDTSTIAAGVLEHARGDYREALGLFETGVTSTRARGDVQASAWATIGRAAAELGLGRTEACLGTLGEVAGLLGGSDFRMTDKGTEINYFAILVPALHRGREAGEAFAVAARASQVIHDSAVMMFYTLAGYAGVAEVLLRLWEEHPADGRFARLPRLARRALRDLERFARLFPIARPYGWHARGLYEWQRGRAPRAHAAWRRAIVLGARLGMLRPLALGHYEIGRHLPAADPSRGRHLGSARRLFAAGAMDYEVGLVDRALPRA